MIPCCDRTLQNSMDMKKLIGVLHQTVLQVPIDPAQVFFVLTVPGQFLHQFLPIHTISASLYRNPSQSLPLKSIDLHIFLIDKELEAIYLLFGVICE